MGVSFSTVGTWFYKLMKGPPFNSNKCFLKTQGIDFFQILEGVNLPSGLQNLPFGHELNQCLEGVNLPGGLKNLTFGFHFDHALPKPLVLKQRRIVGRSPCKSLSK